MKVDACLSLKVLQNVNPGHCDFFKSHAFLLRPALKNIAFRPALFQSAVHVGVSMRLHALQII